MIKLINRGSFHGSEYVLALQGPDNVARAEIILTQAEHVGLIERGKFEPLKEEDPHAISYHWITKTTEYLEIEVPGFVQPICRRCRDEKECPKHKRPARAQTSSSGVLESSFGAMIGEQPRAPQAPAPSVGRPSRLPEATSQTLVPKKVKIDPRSLSIEERIRQATEARTELARRKLSWFVRLAFENVRKSGTKLEWSWYLDAICDHVQSLFEDWLIANGHEPDTLPGLRERVIKRWEAHGIKHEEKRLLVQNLALNVAPGTLKSEIVMVMLPAWAWLHHPSFQWGCSSGASSNVTRDSDAHRDLVRSPWYRNSFEITWEVRGDIDAKELWSTTAGGSRLSRGMSAKWTGVHVDALLLDDPDDAYGVFGEPARKAVQGQFTTAMENRVNEAERSFRIIVQQHVHIEDLSNHLLSLGPWEPTDRITRARWAKLEIAMEFRPDRRHTTHLMWTDPRTTQGEIMHPERFSPEFLASKREKLGSYGYEAQYNQACELLDGGWFNRDQIRFFRMEDVEVSSRPRPAMCRSRDPKAENFEAAYTLERDKRGELKIDFLALSVDATFGSKKASASNVGLLAFAGQGNRRFVFDDRTKARTFLETMDGIIDMIKDWRPGKVLIEKKANGAAVLEELEKALAEAKIRDENDKPIHFSLHPIEPKDDGGSKEGRAASAMPVIRDGLLYILDGAPWADDFVGELCAFPNGRKDDRVDALTQAINFYRSALSTADRWEALAAF